jgi:hypothetical protein
MSAIAATRAAAKFERSSHARRPSTSDSTPAHASVHTHRRGGRVLFEVPFTSAMSDSDLSLLAHVLDLWTHMHPKMRPDPNSPGVVRLDHFSGLFLERGADEGQWVLQARSWGEPAPQSVREWHVLAAQAARQLDASVTLPERLPDPQLETRDHRPPARRGHAQTPRTPSPPPRRPAMTAVALSATHALDPASRAWLAQLRTEGPARGPAVARLRP